MAHARIGRFRLKDGGAEVVAIHRGAPIRNDQKDHFTNHTGAAFDSYVLAHGYEPDAVVLVMGGLKQSARVAYSVRGDSQGGATSMLALAQAAIQREMQSND